MLNQLYAIAEKELKLLGRDAGFWGGLIVAPICFILLFSLPAGGGRPIGVLVLDRDRGPAGGAISAALRGGPLLRLERGPATGPAPELARAFLQQNGSDVSAALIFPENFSDGLRSSGAGGEASAQFLVDPAAKPDDFDRVERALSDQILLRAGLLAGAGGENRAEPPPAVSLQRAAPGGPFARRPVTTEERNLPAGAVFSLFFIVQIIGGTFVRERDLGTFHRLRAAPLPQPVLLLGKLLPFYAVSLLQLALIFVLGRLVFHLGGGASLPALAAVALATAAVANALGLLVAAAARTHEQMIALSSTLMLGLAALGGVLVPGWRLPGLLRTLAWLTPHAWAFRGFEDILVRGYGLAAVWPTAAVLWAFAAVLDLAALLCLRWR